jgi:hypothetical protein
MNLYNLTGNFLEVQKMLEDDTDNEALIGTLESIECAIEEKAQNTVYMLKNIQAYGVGIDAEIKRLDALSRSIDAKEQSLKEFLFGQLELAGIKEIKTNICTIKQQNNPPSVVIIDAGKIPAKYQTCVPESYVPRKNDIAKDLKAGIIVPGAELNHSVRWQIK